MGGMPLAYIENSSEMIGEIERLRSLENNIRTETNQPLLLTLGPTPGSFFFESNSLGFYRWGNLPCDLEDRIQQEVGRRRHGTIYDVAINASGGWVMQFREGKKYTWGGALPEALKDALIAGTEEKKQIMVRIDVHSMCASQLFNR